MKKTIFGMLILIVFLTLTMNVKAMATEEINISSFSVATGDKIHKEYNTKSVVKGNNLQLYAYISLMTEITDTTISSGGLVTAYSEVVKDANLNNVTWTSSNESVATVDSTGKVTGVAVGSVTITASIPPEYRPNATFSVNYTLDVVENEIPITDIKPAKVLHPLQVGFAKYYVYEDEELDLYNYVNVVPVSTTMSKDLEFTADKSSVTIEKGVLTSSSLENRVTITIKSVANPSASTTWDISVKPHNYLKASVQSISIPVYGKGKISVESGGNVGGTIKSWSVADDSIARIYDATEEPINFGGEPIYETDDYPNDVKQFDITCLKKGTTSISVTNNGNLTETIDVTCDLIVFAKDADTCNVGETFTVNMYHRNLEFLPSNITSSDTSKVEVEVNPGDQLRCYGCTVLRVKCKKEGESTITAISSDRSIVANMKIIVEGESPEPTNDSYTITFDGNGGNTCSPNTKTIAIGNEVGTLCTPSRKGYTFNGWFTLNVGGKKVTKNSTIDEDITLYAQWIKNVSNPKTGISSPAMALIIITIICAVGFFKVKKRNMNLE